MPSYTTAAIADRHEALHLRLSALAAHAQALAARRAGAEVPAETRRLAEDLLFELRPFLSSRARAPLPAAAPGYAGLAAQLGEALAMLDAWEMRRTHWSVNHKCFVWNISREAPLPVRRLRPQPAVQLQKPRRASCRGSSRNCSAGSTCVTSRAMPTPSRAGRRNTRQPRPARNRLASSHRRTASRPLPSRRATG